MKSNFYKNKKLIIGAIISVFSLLAFGQADYPNRPVKVIVPFGPGSVPESIPQRGIVPRGQLAQDVDLPDRRERGA